MKRPVLIIIGAIMVLVLLVVWVYVLFFSTPDTTDDQFAEFNLGDTTDTTVDTSTPTTDPEPVVDVQNQDQKRLRQLTTEPIAGYQYIQANASSTPYVFYITAGTGHIFSIDLVSGEEKRVSGTTIPLTQSGVITPDGQYALFQSGYGNGAEFVVGHMSTTSESLTTGLLAEDIISFAATTDNTFLYAVQTTNSVIGKQYYPISDTSETLFTIPFREATISWGTRATDVHYAYPKAASQLEGFLYQIADGVVRRLPVDGFGLSAVGNAQVVLYSKQTPQQYETFTTAADATTAPSDSFILDIIPEKCTPLATTPTTLVCAATFDNHNQTMPDDWYKGTIQPVDDLWEITIHDNSSASTYLSDTEADSGRQLDITALRAYHDDSNVFFINKTDQTLWLFVRTLSS